MKTTVATKFPKHLLLAAEKGFSAIPGAMAVPINSWADFKKVLKQLKSDAAKEKYSTIILDTVDLFYDFCEKYICANAKRPDGGFGVDSISDLGYGRGYTLAAKEFDDCLRSIPQMDYGLVMISHATDKTFKDENGSEFNQIVPTLGNKARDIVTRMSDIVGYARAITDEKGSVSTKLFMRGTPRFIAGSRFAYTPDVIDFSYDNLVKAINIGIDKQEEVSEKNYFTNETVNLYKENLELNFDELIDAFNAAVIKIQDSTDPSKFSEFWAPRITQITDKYLGKGNRVNDCSRDQTEAISLIISDMDDLINENLKPEKYKVKDS